MGELHEEHGPECTCGCHEHVGEHDHGHGHGHDHAHDHDHGHAHDHDRAHAHDHDHAHDHAHDHTHEHEVKFSWGTAVIESHVHDQAATVSATIRAHADAGKTFEALVRALPDIARQVESAGAIVGHIKAYARAGESFAHASATDAQHDPTCEGELQTPLNPDTQCQLVAIALLIDLDELEQIVLTTLR